jgi:hypothetical protein
MWWRVVTRIDINGWAADGYEAVREERGNPGVQLMLAVIPHPPGHVT